MTKKQFHSAINKDVYEYMNQNHPEFDIDFNENGGRVIFSDTTSNKPWDDSIEYHQSRHDLCTLNMASDKVKAIEKELENWIKALIKQYQ
jgi:hypothetical protein